MQAVETVGWPIMAVILSMEVDDGDSFESKYLLRTGNQVKYLISPRTFEKDRFRSLLSPYLSFSQGEMNRSPHLERRNQRRVESCHLEPSTSWRQVSMESY